MNLVGKKEVLGIWLGAQEGARFWLGILTELKNRGLEDIFIAYVIQRFLLRADRLRRGPVLLPNPCSGSSGYSDSHEPQELNRRLYRAQCGSIVPLKNSKLIAPIWLPCCSASPGLGEHWHSIVINRPRLRAPLQTQPEPFGSLKRSFAIPFQPHRPRTRILNGVF